MTLDVLIASQLRGRFHIYYSNAGTCCQESHSQPPPQAPASLGALTPGPWESRRDLGWGPSTGRRRAALPWEGRGTSLSLSFPDEAHRLLHL